MEKLLEPQAEEALQPGLVGPDPTANPELKHYAFSRGYRAALQEKRLTDMPSSIRRSTILRSEFENGWQTAKAELEAGKQFNRSGYIRQRVTWIVITAIGGLATAYLMIGSIFLERAFNQNILEKPADSLVAKPTIAKNFPIQPTTNNAHLSDGSLDLFSADERQILASILDEQPKTIEQQPLVQTDIKIEFELFDTFSQTKILTEFIPKNIRSLQAKIKLNQTQNYKIRWLWQRQLIQEETFSLMAASLEAKKAEISSQIQLASGWSGKWEVELLDNADQLIYVYQFFYAQEN